MLRQTILLDASGFKKFECEKHGDLSILHGYRKSLNFNDLEFGSAFHSFRAEFRKTGDVLSALKSAQDYYSRPMLFKSNKKFITEEYLAQVCTEYASKYTPDIWTPISPESVEVRFSLPYLVEDDIEVLLCGTIDELAVSKSGAYAFIDAKVTSAWNSETFNEGFYLSSQMRIYRWLIQQYGIWKPASIAAKIDSSSPACMIDGVFLKSNGLTELRRSDLHFFDEESIQETGELIENQVQKVVQIARDGKSHRTGLLHGLCNRIVDCEFFKVCSAPDEFSRQRILSNEFTSIPYNPMTHGL